MKKLLWIIAACLFVQTATAQVAPKWMEKARKAVFSIITYNQENQIKSSGNGFYIDMNGTALSDYTLFEGAHRATVVTAEGKQYPVTSISGANSVYDVVKFNAPVDKKPTALTLASQPAKPGDVVYLLPYSTQKSTNVQTGKVIAVDSIGNQSFYYTLEMKTNDKIVSCPIMNAAGEVLGLIQKSSSDKDGESYAIGAGYGAALNISALSLNDRALGSINIKKALPETEEQATIYLFMASTVMNPTEYAALLDDFISLYPSNYEGYIRRAALYMDSDDAAQYPLADKDFEKAESVAAEKSEVLFNISKTMHAYILNLNGKEGYEKWNLERALDYVRKAINVKPEPIYIQQEGDILFTMQNYPEAFASYEKVNQSNIASAATFYSAAKTKQLIEGTDLNEVIALMDSAVVRFTKPYTSEAAPYFYERAVVKALAGKNREAVADYNAFYDALQGSVTATFYYQRQQSEIQCKMNQQALNDINKAVDMEPENILFLIEKGSMHIRFNQIAEAVEVLNKAISIDATSAAAYRMLGYCQVKQNKNKEACANFQKAKELGDEVVDQLIEKYCK